MSQSRVRELIVMAFGLTGFGFLILMPMNNILYPFFLTEVIKISPALMATTLLIGRIGDIVSMPFIGAALEKYHFRWGKYRSWLLITPIFVGIFMVLTFSNPNISPLGKAVYLGAMYFIACIGINFKLGALYTMIPIIGKHPLDRMALAARRSQFGSAAAVIFGLIAMPMILFFTGNGATVGSLRGYIITCSIFAAILVVTYLCFFKVTAEFDDGPATAETQAVARKEKLSAKEMAAQVFANPPLLSLLFASSCVFTAMFIVTSLVSYYFLYIIDNMMMLAVYFSTVAIIQFGASLVVPYICKVIDKRNAFILSLVLMAVSHILAWTFAGSATSFIALIGISYVGISFANAILMAMLADTTEYGEFKLGKSAKGFVMTWGGLPPKVGLIISSAVIGYGLGAIGYVAGAKPTPEFISGLKALIHLSPTIWVLLGAAAVALFNKLTESKVREIQQALQARIINN